MKIYFLIGCLAVSLLTGCNASPEDDYKKGRQELGKKNYSHAIELFFEACRRNYFEACMDIGDLYLSGREGYFAPSFEKANEAWLIAAKGGYEPAQNNIAISYWKGEGIEKNTYEAYQWFLKAAKQGNTNAQNALDRICKESPWACK